MSKYSMDEDVMNAKIVDAMNHLYNQCVALTAKSKTPELVRKHWDVCQHEISGIATALIFLDLDTGAAWARETELMKLINAHRFLKSMPSLEVSTQDEDQPAVSSAS